MCAIVNNGIIQVSPQIATPQVKKNELENLLDKSESQAALSPVDNPTGVAQFLQGTALANLSLFNDQEASNDFAKTFGFESVKDLQNWVGANTDGVIGAETLNKLQNYLQTEQKNLKNSLEQEIPKQLGVETLSQAQEILGATPDGILGEETLDKVDTFINSGNIINGLLNTQLKAKEFEAMIKVMQINMKNLDILLNMVQPKPSN